jgi:hypothetical protein
MYPVDDLANFVPWYNVPGAKQRNHSFLGIIQFQEGDIIEPSNDEGLYPSSPDRSDSNLLTAVPSAAEYAPNATHFMHTEIDLYAGAADVN